MGITETGTRALTTAEVEQLRDDFIAAIVGAFIGAVAGYVWRDGR